MKRPILIVGGALVLVVVVAVVFVYSSLESIVKTKRTTSGSGTKRRRKTTYEANVRYEYTVDGTRHTSRKVSFGQSSSSSAYRAEDIVDKYPTGAAIEAAYNPDKPDVAVLEPGVTTSSYIPLGVGIVFIIAGIGTAIVSVVTGKQGGANVEVSIG